MRLFGHAYINLNNLEFGYIVFKAVLGKCCSFDCSSCTGGLHAEEFSGICFLNC